MPEAIGPVPDSYRDPLPRESPHAFRRFRAWLSTGGPPFAEFAEEQGCSPDAVRRMARRNRWRSRLAAKVLDDATEEADGLAADRDAVLGMAYRTARETMRRCRAQRRKLQESMDEREWAFSGSVRAATESITSEELRAVRILRVAEQLGGTATGLAGGDRTDQHGPARASIDEVEPQALAPPDESADELLAQLEGSDGNH